jgi:uncharacterized protein
MKRSIKFSVLVAVLVAALAVLALPSVFAQDATPEPAPADGGTYPLNTITVVGIGTARGEPDLARVEVGVEVFNANVSEAFAEANTTLENIVNALTELGIAEEDINTSNLSVYNSPRYNPTSGAEERGYTVSNTVRVTVRDVSQIEAVIDAAIGAGATQLYGLSFDIEDRSELEGEARTSAIEDARARAEQYASLIGATLGDVIVVAEGNTGGFQPFFGFDAAQAEGRGGGGAFVQPGQSEVQLQVQVTYSITR